MSDINKTIAAIRAETTDKEWGWLDVGEAKRRQKLNQLADAYEAKESENVRLAKEVAAINKGAKTNARVVELLNKKVIQLQAENAELREAVESALRSLDAANDPERAIEWLEAVLDKYKESGV